MLLHMGNRESKFWYWFQEQLRAADMSPIEFAEHAGIHRSVVARLLNGTTQAPDLPNARRIAAGLGVSLSEVLIAAGLAEEDDFKAKRGISRSA
jgi:transcriptional regulator with XRE-family HTH domain